MITFRVVKSSWLLAKNYHLLCYNYRTATLLGSSLEGMILKIYLKLVEVLYTLYVSCVTITEEGSLLCHVEVTCVCRSDSCVIAMKAGVLNSRHGYQIEY